MPPVDPQGQSPKFRLWLRRHPGGEGSYALRFEVQEAKGILRVSRPGVLIDPPARPMGLEERLTAPQLKTTRFILVWDGGRARQGHLLSRLEEPGLHSIEADRWHELEVLVDSGFRYVVIPLALMTPEPPAPEKARRPSLSELRHELDSITTRGEDDEDADSALASLTGPSPIVPKPAKKAKNELTEVPERGAEPTLSSAPLVRSPDTHEVARGDKKKPKGKDSAPNSLEGTRTNYYEPPASDAPKPAETRQPTNLYDAKTVHIEKSDPPAGRTPPIPPFEDDESFAMAESELDDDIDSALEFGKPGANRLGGNTDATEAPEVSRSGGRAAPPNKLDANFLDDDEEAAFSIDLPSFRKPTDHVNVMREGDDSITDVPSRGSLKPIAVESLDAPPDEDVVLPVDEDTALVAGEDEDDTLLAAGEEETLLAAGEDETLLAAGEDETLLAAGEDESELDLTGGEDETLLAAGEDESEVVAVAAVPSPSAALEADRLPTEPAEGGPAQAKPPPWADLPKRDLVNSPTLIDEGGDDDDGRTHRNSTTLVRHLRRQVEDQRGRISQLEARIAELEAGVAAKQGHG